MPEFDLIHQLFQAVTDGDLDKVKDLLSQGVAWNSLMDGKSVGDVALENGFKQIYDFLVEEGN
jgi:ketosteroid isomerase-like protein